MCELLGLCFRKPISADFTLREFAMRGQQNADGWGLAWYPDQSAAVVKEPLSWKESNYTGFLESYRGLTSSLYIGHVRHRTFGGDPTYADTHPFLRELGGREYCFAHNGTLVGLDEDFPLGQFRPLGTTDTEHAFCCLLDALAGRERCLDTDTDWRWLHEKLARLNEYGKLNCILSDGRSLFCYRDRDGYKGLTRRKVVVGSQKIRRFDDAEIHIELEGRATNHGVVVATQPLNPSGWHAFQPTELAVYQAGRLVFSTRQTSRTVVRPS